MRTLIDHEGAIQSTRPQYFGRVPVDYDGTATLDGAQVSAKRVPRRGSRGKALGRAPTPGTYGHHSRFTIQ